jgi:SAM-dependent methyltransferase
MSFQTDFRYTDRVSKAEYVWRKYQSLLAGQAILDVGADECHLKRHLPAGSSYWGIGLGGAPDQQVNLEREGIPLPDRAYDVALCLDVLEHIENPHAVFDHLARVTRRHVILSLPNALGGLWRALHEGGYRDGQLLKYYGFPPEHPGDRHKWFLWPEEIEAFVRHRAAQNHLRVLQIDYEPSWQPPPGWRGWRLRRALRQVFRPGFPLENLFRGPAWIVLEHPASARP